MFFGYWASNFSTLSFGSYGVFTGVAGLSVANFFNIVVIGKIETHFQNVN
jgi:hypothetical protein